MAAIRPNSSLEDEKIYIALSGTETLINSHPFALFF